MYQELYQFENIFIIEQSQFQQAMFLSGNYPYLPTNYQNPSPFLQFTYFPFINGVEFKPAPSYQWHLARSSNQSISNSSATHTHLQSNIQDNQFIPQLRGNIPENSRQTNQRIKRNQNPSRNLKSNIFKIFIKSVNEEKFLRQYQKLLDAHNLDYPFERFIQELNHLFFPLKNYIRPSIIKKVCSRQYTNQKLGFIFRSQFKKYIIQELPSFLLRSQKKNLYVRNRKSLLQTELLNLIDDDSC